MKRSGTELDSKSRKKSRLRSHQEHGRDDDQGGRADNSSSEHGLQQLSETVSSRWSTAAVLGNSNSSCCDEDCLHPSESASITTWLGDLPGPEDFKDPATSQTPPSFSRSKLSVRSVFGSVQLAQQLHQPEALRVEHPHVRVSNVGEADVELRASGHVPEAVRRHIDLVCAECGAPDLGPEALAQHVEALREMGRAGCSEEEVRQLYMDAMFPREQHGQPGEPLARAVALCATSGAHGVEEHASPFGEPIGAPTIVYGYSSDEKFAFTGEHLDTISTITQSQSPSQSQPQSQPQARSAEHEEAGALRFPFFVLGFGQLDAAQNRCARASMACIRASERLRHVSSMHDGPAAGLFAPADNICFSVIANERHAEISVTWHDETAGQFLTQQVAQYAVTAPDDFRRLRRHVRNILEYGRTGRLAKIRATLAVRVKDRR